MRELDATTILSIKMHALRLFIFSKKFLSHRVSIIRSFSGKPSPSSGIPTNNSAESSAHSRAVPPPPHPPVDDDKDLRRKIQSATLLQVGQHGWTSLAIDAALTELGLSPAAAQLLPAGIATVATDLDADCNRLLAKHLHELRSHQVISKGTTSSQSSDDVIENTGNDSTMNDYIPPHGDSPPDRAAYAMRYRLSLLDPYHQFWYQAVGLRPRVPRHSLRNRLLLADEIAAYADYNSPNVRFSNYSKNSHKRTYSRLRVKPEHS